MRRFRFQSGLLTRFVRNFMSFRVLLRYNGLLFLFRRALLTILMRIFRRRNASKEGVRHFVIRTLRSCRLNVIRLVIFRLATNGNSKDFKRLLPGRRSACFITLTLIVSFLIRRLHVLGKRLLISGAINDALGRNVLSSACH